MSEITGSVVIIFCYRTVAVLNVINSIRVALPSKQVVIARLMMAFIFNFIICAVLIINPINTTKMMLTTT